MSSQNPIELLAPAWARYKAAHQLAVQKVSKSFRYESRSISDWLYGESVHEDSDARREWLLACGFVFGGAVSFEWIGSAHDPACIVNGIFMFS